MRIAKQYGVGYLTLMLMEERGLVERQARAAGIGDLKVTRSTFRSSDTMNDALLSGSVDFVCLGVTGLATIWAKTRGNADVRAVSGLNFLPLQLNSRSPQIKRIMDFTDQDKIALPAVKVSMQATLLRLWAEKELDEAGRNRLNSLAVSMTHPDGMAALISGGDEINNHFTSPPFSQMELDGPGIHKGRPQARHVFMKALQEATDLINRDKRAAAQTYLRMTNGKQSVDDIVTIMTAPGVEYSLVPRNIMPFVDFMVRSGTVKTRPESWKDLFFPVAYAMEGS